MNGTLSPQRQTIINILSFLYFVIAGSAAIAQTTSSIGVRASGAGPTVIFIPGLNSSGAGFDGACAAISNTHQCLLLQLPGFAGQEAMPLDKGFLVPVRDQIIELIRDRQLSDVTLVGHSLGGNVSMMIALAAPELVSRLMLIDSAPFYPALQNPGIRVETGAIMATSLRAQMAALSDEQYRLNAPASMSSMSNNPESMAMILEWTLSSDRMTTAEAMADMLTTDLREDIAAITQPVLLLGAWAAYEAYGSTLESTKAIFAAQYAALPNVDIRMSQSGYHFLMLDDAKWLNSQLRQFIAE